MIPLIPLALLAFLAGIAWRRAHRPRVDHKRHDKRADRVLPMSWEQEGKLYALAEIVARRDDRHVDHVLVQYGLFDYGRGRSRTMQRKKLSRAEAERIIARIEREESVSIPLPDRDKLGQGRDPLAPRDDEEPF